GLSPVVVGWVPSQKVSDRQLLATVVTEVGNHDDLRPVVGEVQARLGRAGLRVAEPDLHHRARKHLDNPSRRGRVVVLKERARCGPLVGLRVMLVPEDADLVLVETTTAERTVSGSDLAYRLWVRGGAGIEFDACAQPQGSSRRCPVAGLTNQV